MFPRHFSTNFLNGFDFKVSQRRFELACAFFIFAEKGQDAVDARDLR